MIVFYHTDIQWYSTPILIPQMVRWEMEGRERNELGSEGKQSTGAREGQAAVAQILQLIYRRKRSTIASGPEQGKEEP